MLGLKIGWGVSQMPIFSAGPKSVPLLSALYKKLDYLNENQKHLSDNIARYSDPDAKAWHLKPMSFRQLVSPNYIGQMHMNVTDPRHMRIYENKNNFEAQEILPPEGLDPEHNIVLEDQMSRITQNQLAHKLITNVYKKHIEMAKHVIKG